MARFLRRLTAHDRASEAMVGLMVALATRGTVRIAGGHDVDPLVLAAASLSATLAWAVVDAAIFILAAKGSRLRWSHVTSNNDPSSQQARRWVDEALGQTLLAGLDARTRGRIRDDIVRETARIPASNPRLTRGDWVTGLAVTTVVLVAGIPAIIPLLVIPNPDLAAWASYGIALVLMFLFGAHWGPAHGLRPLRSGLAMLAIGGFLTALVLALGG